jgi:hypothetical protein
MGARVCLVLCLMGGCYGPSLTDPGFYCHVDDNPACPDDQVCADGRCVYPALHLADDAGSPDLPPPSDLGLSCQPTGGACNHDDSVCCSHYCVYKTGKCK